MAERIIIAGAGGQGIMLLGKVLAESAMRLDKYTTCLPCYGPEVRGGTANCMVVISDEEIGSPYVDIADDLIIMNEPSLHRFKDRIKEKGLLIINRSLAKTNIVSKATVLSYPFTDIALELGNIKTANMVALGCFMAKNKIIDKVTVLEVFKYMTPPHKSEIFEINQQALLAGMKLIKKNE
jgi:2-oxoglutarate ferredoxin oxidoreductase subunit gamma